MGRPFTSQFFAECTGHVIVVPKGYTCDVFVVEMNTKSWCINFAIFSCLSKLCYDWRCGHSHVCINAESDSHKIWHQAAEKNS